MLLPIERSGHQICMGDFNLSSLHDAAASSAGSTNSVAANSLLGTGPTVSCLWLSCCATLGGATAQWSGFHSVVHTSAPTTKRKGTFSLKVLVAPTLGVLTRIRFILAQSTKYIYIHNGSYSKPAIYSCGCQRTRWQQSHNSRFG